MWDPRETLGLGTRPNHHLSHITEITNIAVTNSDNIGNDDEKNDDKMSITELDSHANMVVVERHAAIISNTGRK